MPPSLLVSRKLAGMNTYKIKDFRHGGEREKPEFNSSGYSKELHRSFIKGFLHLSSY